MSKICNPEKSIAPTAAKEGMGDGMIDIVIRHGGRMDFSGSVPKYVGGEENVVGFDTDYLSYRTLVACAKEDLGDHCGWRVYGSWNSKREAFVLKCLGDNHKCPRALENKQASTKWIAKTYLEKFRLNPKWDVAAAKEAFWKAVYASNEVEYDAHANKLKELQEEGTDKKAYDDFLRQEPKSFCRAFLSTDAKSDSVESNICESFNNAIVRFRDLRVIKMLEGIRSYIMVRMVEQHNAFKRMKDAICPTILEQIEWTKLEARTCIIQPSLDDVLECSNRGKGFVVDLQRKCCTCGYWQLSGVPCMHAIVAISYMRYDINNYIHEWYSVQVARRAYTKGIQPLPGREDWKEVDGNQVLPPPYKVLPGRPKKNRRKEPGEIPTRPTRTGVGMIRQEDGEGRKRMKKRKGKKGKEERQGSGENRIATGRREYTCNLQPSICFNGEKEALSHYPR
ncbi:hypothetical protein LINPERHAP1_LOCUS31190 [Linum perenne]